MTANIDSFSDNHVAPLNREEFSASVTAYRRRSLWVVLILVLALFLMLWAIVVAASFMNDAGIPLESPWRYLLMGSIIPFLFIEIWVANLFLQHPLLKCPHCSNSFVGGMDPYFAIVTGRCSSCAKSLFESTQPACDETKQLSECSLLSREELAADLKAVQRSAVRPTLVWVMGGVLLLVIGAVSGPWLSELSVTRLGDVWTPFVRPALLAPGIVVGTWALAVWAHHSRATRPCPHCRAPISPSDVATVTGNCSTCGERAVSDPLPGIEPGDDSDSETWWAVEEYEKLAKHYHDRLWIGCFVGGGFAATWILLLQPLLKSGAAPQVSFDSIWGTTLIIGAFVGILLFQCGGALLWHWYSARHLRCPECRSELLHFYRLVVSSKRCYHCAATVIGEPAGDAPE